MTNFDSPPAYDVATGSDTNTNQHNVPFGDTKKDVADATKAPPSSPEPQIPSPRSHPVMPTPALYHWVDPITQNHISSVLPPDHPQMICLQRGYHEPQTKFGLLGIIVAVVWFPLGVALCLLDRRVKCKSCGMLIRDGVCG